MSAYLKFFQLECSPFDTGSQSSVVLGTRAIRDAYTQIEAGLVEQAPRICVYGGTGLGKTSLARALPKLLRDQARVVLLLNPALSWVTLKAAIVRQLDLPGGLLSRTSLAERRKDGQRIVIVIDAAEKISGESLEHLDMLLAYRTDSDEQLVHCVLLANLDQARQQPDCPLLWWLDSLNTLQLEFAPIPVDGVRSYIVKHLKRAGWTGGDLFSAEAARAIHRITGGVPRSVSELCERVLTEAAEQAIDRIDAGFVEAVCGEGPARDATDQRTAASADHAAEVVLEEVATPPTRTSARRRPTLDPDAEVASDTRPRRPDPRVDPAPAARAPSNSSAGLDAFFGPASQAAHVAAHARPDPALAEAQEPLESAAASESDTATRRGRVRWLAAAAALFALLGAGLYFAGIVPGDGSTELATAVAEAPIADASRATGPTPAAERLARHQRASTPSASGDVVEAGGTKRQAAVRKNAKRARASAGLVLDLAEDTSGQPSVVEPAPNHDDERLGSAVSPPASPALPDPMDLGTERHF